MCSLGVEIDTEINKIHAFFRKRERKPIKDRNLGLARTKFSTEIEAEESPASPKFEATPVESEITAAVPGISMVKVGLNPGGASSSTRATAGGDSTLAMGWSSDYEHGNSSQVSPAEIPMSQHEPEISPTETFEAEIASQEDSQVLEGIPSRQIKRRRTA